MSTAEHDDPVVQCAAWGRLVTVLRDLVTAQAAGDVAAVIERGPALRERTDAVAALVRAGLGGEQGHPAGAAQAALLARDVFVAARHTGALVRGMLGRARHDRNVASATVCGGVWWCPRLTLPDDIAARFPSVLSLGAGALARRAGVAVTGSGELIYVEDGKTGAQGTTDMVVATAWLQALVEAGQLAVATFTTSDSAWLTGLDEKMRKGS